MRDQLRKEFWEAFHQKGVFNHLEDENEITDWFISKFDSLLHSKIEEIEKLKKEIRNSDIGFLVDEAYNTALKDVIKILKS